MKRRAAWLFGLLLALGIAGLLSPWASPWPDGLDRVAAQLGFARREGATPIVAAPLPGYRVGSVGNERWSTALAGLAGTLVVFGGAYLFGYLLRRKEG
jgi:cobalt/nickel transport protein